MQPLQDVPGGGRHEIVQTARLLFNTRGFDQTTLEDLLRALNIGEGVFLENFNSMDQLLEVVWSER